MPSIPYKRFARELLDLYEPPLRAKSTYRQMKQVLNEFEVLGVKNTSEIRPSLVARWIKAHPGRTTVTAASHLRAFKAACSYGVGEGYIRASPFDYRSVGGWVRDDTKPRQRNQRHKSASDIARVLALLDGEASGGQWESGRLQALVYTYAYTGMRAGEALHLWRSDVDLSRRVITITAKPGWKPKTISSASPIGIADALAEVLARWLPRTGCDWVFPGKRLRSPWTGGYPGSKPLDQVKAAGDRAGVPGLTIQGFRKTIGTLAKSWGFSPLELKGLLRHTQLETQKWYDEEDLEILHMTARKITFKIGG